MFRLFKNKSRGQALVEYALLLLVVTLSATAFLSMNDSLKNKIRDIGMDYETDVALIPEFNQEIKGCTTNDDCLELSPPVAKFQVPSPLYKGREFKIIDESYDPDGYVEHYIWSIDGSILRMTKEEVEKEGGIKHKFRHSGTYSVSLMVIDNDGLISNLETNTITVINRNPTLSLSVENEKGDIGDNVTVEQYCTATFYTSYTDPDLPYDELTAFSRFTDQNGETKIDNSAPNEFNRDFPNLGTNTYYVRITDEDGATASKTVSVNVVPNPTGSCKSDQEKYEDPKYRIQVEGHYKIDRDGAYLFIPGTSATLKPIVQWGTFDAHDIPYYWESTDDVPDGIWFTPQLGGVMKYPHRGMFFLDQEDIRVTGMARDKSALTNDPNPNRRGMSNQDTVILRVDGSETTLEKYRPVPIITLENKKYPSNKETVRQVDLTDPTSTSQKKYETNIESVTSQGAKDASGIKVKGVRWKEPDGTWRPKANENGAEELIDVEGNSNWYYLGTVNSPDTIASKRQFSWKNNDNEWTYELEVINENHIKSKNPTKKTIKVLFDPNKPPVAVCNPSPAYTVTGKPVTLDASGSTDPDGKTAPVARWKNGSGSWTSWRSISTVVPQSWTWSSTGNKTIKLEVRDERGAVTSKNCTVTVEKPTTNFKFKPQINYIESRVDHIGKPLKVRNRTSSETHQFYSGFTAKGTNGQYKPTLTPMKNYFGLDKTSGWQNNEHTQRKFYNEKGQPTVYSTFVHVTDSTGRSNTAQCEGGELKTVTISGQRLTNACSKGTHFFRMAPYNKNQANLGTGGISKGSYCSIHPTWKKFSDYSSVYNRTSGLYDAYGNYSIDGAIKRMLNNCTNIKPNWDTSE